MNSFLFYKAGDIGVTGFKSSYKMHSNPSTLELLQNLSFPKTYDYLF